MKIKSFVFFFFIFSFLYGQEYHSPNFNFYELNQKKWTLGYFAGINYFDFDLKIKNNEIVDYLIESKSNLGFHGGLIGKLKIYKYLELMFSPGLYFSTRKLYFNSLNFDQKEKAPMELKSTYLEFPLHLKFSGDVFYDMQPFIDCAIAYMMNLESNEKKTPTKKIFPLKKHNYNFQIEGGLKFYFSFFKMILSLKGLFMINNEFIKKVNVFLPWVNHLKALKTRAILFSIKFE